MGISVERLLLSDKQKAELERRVRAHSSSHRDVRRAKAILFCNEGMSLRQIGFEIDMDQHKVSEWRKRFLLRN